MKKFFSSPWGIIAFAGLIITLVIIFDAVSLFSPVKGAFGSIFEPLESFASQIERRLENFTGFFASRKRLVEENNQLQQQIERLLIENASLFRQEKDLAILREERIFLDEKGYTAVAGKVIGRSIFPFSEAYIVNKGSDDGVKVDAPVITNNGILVGKILNTTSDSSLIQIVTDPESEFAVKVHNDDQSVGIAKGSHGISLDVSKIPYDHTLEPGQRVVTTGSEEGIPPDLVLGTIDSISYQEGELFQSARLIYPTDIANLSVVAIITL